MKVFLTTILSKLLKLRLYQSSSALPFFWFISTKEEPEHLDDSGINYERTLASLLQRLLTHYPFKTFLDIGASFGYFSIVASKYSYDISVHCYDGCLQRALIGKLNLFINSVPSKYHLKFVSSSGSSASVTLEKALTELEEPICVKVDIEGGESDLIRSSLPSLAERCCLVLLEFHERILTEELSEDADQLLSLIRDSFHSVKYIDHRVLNPSSDQIVCDEKPPGGNFECLLVSHKFSAMFPLLPVL